MLERIHSYGIVHRNIRPRKFLTSNNPSLSNEFYLIDFSNALKLKKKMGKQYTL